MTSRMKIESDFDRLRANLYSIMDARGNALRYIRERLPNDNSALHWHLSRLEQILLGNDDGRATRETEACHDN